MPLADAFSLQKLWTSGIMWKRLQHPNVVPFLGFDPTTPPFSLVYPWMSNGSLSEYARKNPHADKISLVRGYPYHGREPRNDPDLPPSYWMSLAGWPTCISITLFMGT